MFTIPFFIQIVANYIFCNDNSCLSMKNRSISVSDLGQLQPTANQIGRKAPKPAGVEMETVISGTQTVLLLIPSH